MVQFLGVAKLGSVKGSGMLPWLIMECLPFNLRTLLESRKNVPIYVKVSLMLDTARGLTYLHNSEQIVHGDLNATHVLVSSSFTAKIAGFGSAKFLQFGHKLSELNMPGNPFYMPPECHGPAPQYDFKMDIFSLGVILLFTITQQFPHERRVASGQSEVERYLDIAKQVLDETKPEWSLIDICRQCLQYDPSRRPTAEDMMANLLDLNGQILDDLFSLDKLELMTAVQQAQVKQKEVRNQLQFGSLYIGIVMLKLHVLIISRQQIIIC